jgi:hypothetical protein
LYGTYLGGLRQLFDKEGKGGMGHGISNKGGVRQRGQWQWRQEQWQQGWQASDGNEGDGNGEGKQQSTSNGIDKGGWWLAREHQQGDHMTTTVGKDKRQERAADDDGSNEEGEGEKGHGDSIEGGGRQRKRGQQQEGWRQ